MWQFAGDQPIVDEFRKISKGALIPFLLLGIVWALDSVGLRNEMMQAASKINFPTQSVTVFYYVFWVFAFGALLGHFKTARLAFRTMHKWSKERIDKRWYIVFVALLFVSLVVLLLKKEDLSSSFRSNPVVSGTILALGWNAAKEEIVFRFFFYYSLVALIGRMPAFVLTILWFAAIHVSWDVWYALVMLTPGYLLTFSMVRSGTLWIPIGLHIGGNLLARMIIPIIF